jgi:hypothetical protein
MIKCGAESLWTFFKVFAADDTTSWKVVGIYADSDRLAFGGLEWRWK